MKHLISSATDRTAFDEFLYAPIGEESNGMLLSVLSALARHNVDPWEEASRLARLPRDAATLFLTTLIAALPVGISARCDPELHAKRLSALLPRSNVGVGIQSTAKAPMGLAAHRHSLVRYALYYAVLAACFFGAQRLMQHTREVDRPAAAVDSPAVSTVVSRGPLPAAAVSGVASP